jgi:hypothetical protein
VTNIPIGGIEEVYETVKKEMGAKLLLSKIRILNLVQNMIYQLQARFSNQPVTALKFGPAPDYKALNEKIFQGMMETCQHRNSDFLLLYIPGGRELIEANYPSPVGDFLEEFAKNHTIHSLNPRKYFLQSLNLKLTKDSMWQLRNGGLEEIVEDLKPLKHQEFTKEDEFLEAVEHHIGKERTVKYHKQILEAANQYRMGHYKKREATIVASAVYEKIKTLSSYLDNVKFSE